MLKSFWAILAVLSFVTLGSVSACAQRGVQSTCDEIFAKYAGDKGFMSLSDFQKYWNGSGHHGRTGSSSIDGGEIAFLLANSGSYQSSKSEFCQWLKHSPEAQR